MKYDVMVEIKEKRLELKHYISRWFNYPECIDIDDFKPDKWFLKVKESIGEYEGRVTKEDFFTGFYRYYDETIHIEAVENIQHKEWVYLKSIDIEDGELGDGDFYEIDGEKCSFEIVYNDKTDKVELRVNYTQEIIKHCSYDKAKAKYDEFNKLLSEYSTEKDLKKEIKRQISEDVDLKLKNTKSSFIKRLLRRC